MTTGDSGPNSATASTLQTAGQLVALLAGVVGAVYILGGLVIAARLLSDGFPADSVVSLLGQASREFVIGTGTVQAIGPAVLVGLAAALAYGAYGGPRPRSANDGDHLTKPRRYRTIGALIMLAFVLTLPGAVLSSSTGDFSDGEKAAWAVAFLVTAPLVLAGWFLKRKLGRRSEWYRFVRAAAAGGIWAGMALFPAVFAVGVLPFQPTQVCLSGTAKSGGPIVLGDRVQLGLVAQTKDRTILTVEQNRGGTKAKSILSLPTSKIVRLQFGDIGTAAIECDDGL